MTKNNNSDVGVTDMQPTRQ